VEREPIVLHEGELTVRKGDIVITGPGRLELDLRPQVDFRFVLPQVALVADLLGEAQLSVTGLAGELEAFVGRIELSSPGCIRGWVQGDVGDGSVGLQEVRFFVLNLSEYFGASLLEERAVGGGGSRRTYWRGRLPLAAGGWQIDLDLRLDHRSLYARLKEQAGFEITHVGSLRRANGACFSSVDAGEVLDALAGFLGFVCGSWATPVAAVGLDSAQRVVWRELQPRWTSPWRSRLCAFDRHKHQLGDAFSGYFERWSDPLWNEPLRIATQLYVEANGPVAADTTLVLGQNVLELIAWVRFVEELQLRSARDFDNPRLKASDRLRELLAWLEVDPAIPTQLTALAEEAARQNWLDGPHAIGEMRNALIHPRQRQRLTTTPVNARIDLQELVLWYVELALLRLIDFHGPYANRLGAKRTGSVEHLPWD
jgi:hypothetical protein